MFNKSDFKIVYMGTPELSAKTFESLINNGWNFVGLIAQEDKEVGRKKIKQMVPTKKVAVKYNIPVFQPHRIHLDFEFVKKIKPDLILTFAYGQIIPQALLDIPPKGCLNLHASLLPKYRGAAPIQRAIMNGEQKTGITLMEMIDKMDAGRMYSKEEVIINEDDNYSSLQDKLSLAAIKIVNEKLPLYLQDKLEGVVQKEEEVTFANKIKEEDEHLNINLNALDQINYIRALSLNPGTYLFLNDKKIKICKAKLFSNEKKYQLGQIVLLNKHVLYQASDGLIELIDVKPENKNMMKASDYINGHKEIVGKILK